MDSNIFLLTIIIANIIFSYKGLNDISFLRKYEFHIGSIRSGEKIRMITSGFLHVDIPHLAFNMIALYSFAPIVIAFFGSFSFITIYFASLIIGNMLTLFFHKDNYSYCAVGASGAVTGILYAAILLVPNLPINLFFIPIDIPGYVFGVLYLLYSIYGMKAKSDNIGHTAHIGGAIGGYVFTLIKAPTLLFSNTFFVIVLAVPILFLIILAKQEKL